MDAIHVDIVGDHQVGVRFEAFPDALYEDLRAEIEALSLELYARVEAATPTLSGALRGQERMRLFTDPDRIKGSVDVAGAKGSQDFAKAGALEYGAHRETGVKAHHMRLDHAWAEKLAAPETVMVEAYTRIPNIAEYAFERGPLEAMAPEIVARLESVVAAAAAKADA